MVFSDYKSNVRLLKNNLTLVLKLTNDCNQKCSYCYHNYKNCEDMKENMKINILKQAILKIGDRAKNLFIHLHGGEPLLLDVETLKEYLDFIQDYMDSNKDRFIECSIQTNLINLSEEKLNLLKNYNIQISTSFDGFTSIKTRNMEINDFINKFNESHANGFVNVITKENINKMDEHISYIETICNAPMCNPVFPFCCPDELKLDPGDFSNFIIKRFEYQLKNNNIFSSDVLEYLEPIVTGKTDCFTSICLNSIITITPQGNIKGCDVRNEKEFIYGNIKDINTLEDIFELPNYINLEKIYYERLKECSKYPCYKYCKGGCINRMCLIDNQLAKDSYCYDIGIIIDYFEKFYSKYENNINKLPDKLKNQLLFNIKGE